MPFINENRNKSWKRQNKRRDGKDSNKYRTNEVKGNKDDGRTISLLEGTIGDDRNDERMNLMKNLAIQKGQQFCTKK